MRGPIIWFGGKGHMTTKIVPLMPPCTTYVEPFGGGASVLLARRPSPVEIYNDLDSALVNFFRVLADPDLFEKFYRRVALLPRARELYTDARATWQAEEDPVKKAALWFTLARQSFSGTLTAWGFEVNLTGAGIGRSWLSVLRHLPKVHSRLHSVQIEHRDWRFILKTYDTPNTLFYCDPPYVMSKRSSGKVYTHEITDQDHKDLVETLLHIQGQAVVSGYEHPVYKRLERAGWSVHRFEVTCNIDNARHIGAAMDNSKRARTEIVWCSPRRRSGLFRNVRQ